MLYIYIYKYFLNPFFIFEEADKKNPEHNLETALGHSIQGEGIQKVFSWEVLRVPGQSLHILNVLSVIHSPGRLVTFPLGLQAADCLVPLKRRHGLLPFSG